MMADSVKLRKIDAIQGENNGMPLLHIRTHEQK